MRLNGYLPGARGIGAATGKLHLWRGYLMIKMIKSRL